MSNVVDIKKAKKIKKIADGITSDEAQRLYDEMKDEIFTIESTLAETLDKPPTSLTRTNVCRFWKCISKPRTGEPSLKI